jgi:hypothetical protein
MYDVLIQHILETNIHGVRAAHAECPPCKWRGEGKDGSKARREARARRDLDRHNREHHAETVSLAPVDVDTLRAGGYVTLPE